MTFTPLDTTLYTSTTASVPITVHPPVPVPSPAPPHVGTIASSGHSRKGLTAIVVPFDRPLNSASATSVSSYTLLGAVKKKGKTAYTKASAASVSLFDGEFQM